MSLSIEIRINGHPVSVITASNVTNVFGQVGLWDNSEPDMYSGCGTHFRVGNPKPDAFNFEMLPHYRKEGILPLCAKILKEAARLTKNATKVPN